MRNYSWQIVSKVWVHKWPDNSWRKNMANVMESWRVAIEGGRKNKEEYENKLDLVALGVKFDLV